MNSQLEIARKKFDEILKINGPVAIIDFPNYNNVGDSAIWLGMLNYLKTKKVDIRYVASIASFSLDVLQRAMPDGLILIQGGGNFGTLWPHHQELREKVLSDCRGYRVVQLPQTLYFENDASFENCAKLIKNHPDFTLMVRDMNSLKIGERLGANCYLSPDAANFLSGILKRRSPIIDVFGLLRRDKESTRLLDLKFDHRILYEFADWDEDVNNCLIKLIGVIESRAHGRFGHLRIFQKILLSIFNKIAWRRVNAGVKQLSRGRVVVTDRLHAHILSSLMDIPNIVLDNHYGKVHGYMEMWGSESSKAVKSADEIGSIVNNLLK